jgi:hypothetical protein
MSHILKGKATPLYSIQALRGTGIAPTHSWSRHRMGRVVSITLRSCFTPEKSPPGTHCIGGLEGIRAGLDTEATGKILLPWKDVKILRNQWRKTQRNMERWRNKRKNGSEEEERQRKKENRWMKDAWRHFSSATRQLAHRMTYQQVASL